MTSEDQSDPRPLEGENCGAWVERDGITGFPLRPPDEMLALDGFYNSCTVYAAVDTVIAPTPAGAILVQLEAELAGIRTVIASAFVTQGVTGAIIDVTGLSVDGWHVRCASTNPKLRLKVGMNGRTCCSAFNVHVRPDLMSDPIAATGEETDAAVILNNQAAILQWGQEKGQYDALSTVDEDGAVDFAPGSRILHIQATAGAAPGSIEVQRPFPGGITTYVVLPNADNLITLNVVPVGALPVGRIEWIGLGGYLLVETVR